MLSVARQNRKDSCSACSRRHTRFEDIAADSSPKTTFAAASRNSGLPVVISYYRAYISYCIHRSDSSTGCHLRRVRAAPPRYRSSPVPGSAKAKPGNDAEDSEVRYLCHSLQFVVTSMLVSIDSHTEVDFLWMLVVVSSLFEMIHHIRRTARDVVEEHLVWRGVFLPKEAFRTRKILEAEKAIYLVLSFILNRSRLQYRWTDSVRRARDGRLGIAGSETLNLVRLQLDLGFGCSGQRHPRFAISQRRWRDMRGVF